MLEMQEICNNFKSLVIGDLELYFSYNTCVAFRKQYVIHCTENVWGRTTGKHLNLICPNHKERINNDNFNALLARNLEELRVA